MFKCDKCDTLVVHTSTTGRDGCPSCGSVALTEVDKRHWHFAGTWRTRSGRIATVNMGADVAGLLHGYIEENGEPSTWDATTGLGQGIDNDLVERLSGRYGFDKGDN